MDYRAGRRLITTWVVVEVRCFVPVLSRSRKCCPLFPPPQKIISPIFHERRNKYKVQSRCQPAPSRANPSRRAAFPIHLPSRESSSIIVGQVAFDNEPGNGRRHRYVRSADDAHSSSPSHNILLSSRLFSRCPLGHLSLFIFQRLITQG